MVVGGHRSVPHGLRCPSSPFCGPGNAGLPYETAEGGYQGPTFMTYEVLDELRLDFPKDRHDGLRNAVEGGLENHLWSEAEPFAFSPDQQLQFSWEKFCRVTKHERRYFFLQEQRRTPRHNDDELVEFLAPPCDGALAARQACAESAAL